MDPEALNVTEENVKQDEAKSREEDLRFKLNNLFLKGCTKWPPKVVNAATLEHLEEMTRVYNSKRLKGFSRSLTGKFVFVGSKLLSAETSQ